MYSLGFIYSIITMLCVLSLYLGHKLYKKKDYRQIGMFMMMIGCMQLGGMIIAFF
jgi:hypothetical protein